MTLKEYLDYTFKRNLENKYEEDSLVHNNGINFLVFSINEQLNTNIIIAFESSVINPDKPPFRI